MGIPKFYRYTSERYPCLSERIKEYQIPEFDNLYLDMNGIIHNCSHPNDEDIHLRIPEQQIFRDIFHYIDFLFKMIKPCKVFFMAVDGVAPRAKMNQQRGRRFRSARVAEDQEAEAVRKGETLPSEERFDSNCITPGTEFMARLHEQLQYFVKVKVSTDPLWQREGLVIYLSGHDVPGEGEHKIMDFIRHIRSKPEYIPVRHCLYGLDADLVMLGLSTHELQFSLLREEVKFSRPKKNKKGVKKPVIKPTEASSYDLTNVTIFQTNGLLRSDMQQTLPTPVHESLLKEGQSFAAALEKPGNSEQIITAQKVELSNSNTPPEPPVKNEIIPPPSDDSKAKGVYRAPLPEKTTFLLLHLSLMRDYIDFEFQELKNNLIGHPKIIYDLEQIIDDWILMNILIGNDFVPHLPHFHIVKGALPHLYKVYTEVLPTLDGYINENGILNLPRFEVFIKCLSQFDIEMFRETYDDMKYMESKTGKNIVLGEKMFQEFEFGEEIFMEPEEALEPMSPELKALAQRTEEEVFGDCKAGAGKLCTDIFQDSDDFFDEDDSPEMKLEFIQHKRNYYISKLQIEEVTPEFLQSFCEEYIRAIQWVLMYYYKGVSSWGWFYPYHYGPFCSDLKNFAKFSVEFEKGQPFKPFEQLLAVLPAQSKKLLPDCYQWLMTDTKSPIHEFYPEKFEQDLNGKKQDWEAVVLIPFIDELRLLKVMEHEEANLSAEEKHRNSKGAMMLCSYTAEETGPVKSPGDLFPFLESSHVKIESLSEVLYYENTLPKGIHPNTKQDTIYQGFPTLKSKKINAVVEKAEIKVFEFVTREESMIISLEDVNDEATDEFALARKLIDRSVWVNWPHLTFALVTSVMTFKSKYLKDPYSGKIVKDKNLIGSRIEKEFESTAKGLIQRHLKCKGIKLGNINVIINAKMMEGRKVRCNSKGDVDFEVQWSVLQQPFALKTCMYEENITEIFYLDRNLASSYLDLYKVGDQVFYLGDKLFGVLGTVMGHKKDKRTVDVEFKIMHGVDNEVNLKSLVGNHTLKSHEYFSSQVSASKCQINAYVLSRITGTVFVSIEKETRAQKRVLAKKAAALAKLIVSENTPNDSSSSDDEFPALEMRKINVGLDLKFNKKNLEVRGYTSKRDGIWYYSGKAIQLVNEFVERFPDFVDFLQRDRGRDGFDASEIFPDNPLQKINEMVEWLEEKGIRDLPRIATNTKLLDDEDIDSVWKYILKHRNTGKRPYQKRWSVRPNLLLKPGLDRGCVPAVADCSFNIFDRVVCIDRGAPIPVGHRGTIVGIQVPQTSEPEQIEESFKSTGAATLMTLIVLCDPATEIFDVQDVDDKNVNQMSDNLASLLRISGPVPRGKINDNLMPRLIKLYPYQLLNVTQGPMVIRQNHQDSKALMTLDVFPVNGYSRQDNKDIPSIQGGLEPARPVRILTRPISQQVNQSTNKPNEPAKDKSTTLQEGSSKQLLQSILQPLIGSSAETSSKTTVPSHHAKKILPWPPKPLQAAPVVDSFSVAAFLQKQFNASPINKSTNSSNPAPVTPLMSNQSTTSQAHVSQVKPLMSEESQQPTTLTGAPHKQEKTTVQNDSNTNLMELVSRATGDLKTTASKPRPPSREVYKPPQCREGYSRIVYSSRPQLPPPPNSWVVGNRNTRVKPRVSHPQTKTDPCPLTPNHIAFIPTQVSRNTARYSGNNPQIRHSRSFNVANAQSTPKNENTLQTENRQLKPDNGKSTQVALDQSTSGFSKSRSNDEGKKSRLAANFGNV